MLDAPGVDTWLARLLLERGRLEVSLLQESLWQVQTARSRGGQTLARSLVGRGLLTEPEALSLLSELSAARTPTHAALTRTPRPPSGQGLVPSAWQIGGCVGAYVLRERLGAGGMGAVFVAEHRTTGARYALKTISRTGDPDLLQRFNREAQAQAAVDAHPNVVRVHSAGEIEGRLFIVMDLAAGGDLQDRLRTALPSFEQATRWVIGLARGLHHAHTHGVLHRDLKPANVVFDEGGTPKLVDFGLASVAWDTQSLTKTGDIMGTPSYMAPEQAGGAGEVDARSDVYGLGAILYEALTGRPPFSSDKGIISLLLAVIQTKPQPVRTLSPSIPSAIEKACMQALAKRPSDRPQSAAAFADTLQAALEGGPSGGNGRSAVLAGALAIAAIGAIGAIGWLDRTPADAPPVVGATGSEAGATGTGGDGQRIPPDDPRDAAPKVTVPERVETLPASRVPNPRNPAWLDLGSDLPLPKPNLARYLRPSNEAFIEAREELRAWRMRAENGDAEAMFTLGVALEEARDAGLSNSERRALALAWFLKARAEGGPPYWTLEATWHAAGILRKTGGRERVRAAAILFAELARSGDHRGCHYLAEMLRRGEGFLEDDPARAIVWFERAVLSPKADSKSFVRLGALLMTRDTENDVTRAKILFMDIQDRPGSAAGEALLHLGELARDGRGEPKDLERGEALFRQAAFGSEPKRRPPYSQGMLRLGDLLRASGDEEDLREAADLYRQTLGASPDWFAKYAAGRLWSMHWHGEPGAPDAIQAGQFLEQAISGGNLGVVRRWAAEQVALGNEQARQASAQATR